METFAPYILKSVISSAVLTSYYWLWLRNKKFHNYNRFFLLFSIILSLIVPVLNFNWFPIAAGDKDIVKDFLATLHAQNIKRPFFRFSLEPLLRVGLLLISPLFLSILFARIIWIYHVRLSNGAKRMDGINLIRVDLKEAPFSFLNNLFWRTDISLNDENGKKIYRHELAHIRQKHTIDKLFSQLVVCVFWMNPFYWLIQKELNIIHEFIADSQSVRAGDTEAFAHMLLQSHNGGKYLDPAHSFFQSPVKRRLAMIADLNKATFPGLRKALVVPVIMLIITIFAFTTANSTQSGYQQDNDPMAKKHRDEKEAMEKAAVKVNPGGRETLVKNNNVSQAILLSAPFLTWKFN